MAVWAEREIAGWGRHPRVSALVARPETRRHLIEALKDRNGGPVLAHGLRRSYGDAALLAGGRVIDASRTDRMLSFDPDSGWLRCEAGVSIADIVSTFLPRGYFPPVVPGTKYVTVAGALASDIHGKNHHVAGTWSNHVRDVELLLASGEVVRCDGNQNPDLLRATAGGQGLTGIILAMDVRLARTEPSIEMESIRVPDLEGFLRVSEESAGFPYTVGWIDGTASGRAIGRGVFMRGRTLAGRLANRREKGVSALIDGRYLSTNWLLNPLFIRAFNSLYYRRQAGSKRRHVTFDRFFFPLDAIRNWNRMYGSRGFFQYQFVVPADPDCKAVRAVLEAVASSSAGAFLGVIKEFGVQANGGLSFPIPGVTVALDFPNTGPKLLALLDRLDGLVADAGGRVYLSKDARLGRDAFRRMYPEWREWKAVKDHYDPHGVFQSELGKRLGLVGE